MGWIFLGRRTWSRWKLANGTGIFFSEAVHSPRGHAPGPCKMPRLFLETRQLRLLDRLDISPQFPAHTGQHLKQHSRGPRGRDKVYLPVSHGLVPLPDLVLPGAAEVVDKLVAEDLPGDALLAREPVISLLQALC